MERNTKLVSADRPRQQRNDGSIFFALPKEIRLEIYSLLLAQHDPVIVNRSTHKRASASGTRTSILRTCTQIHEEAADILYENTFNISDSGRVGLILWLKQIGSRNTARLKHIQITHSQEFLRFDEPWNFDFRSPPTATARVDVKLNIRLAQIVSYAAYIESVRKYVLYDSGRRRHLEQCVERMLNRRTHGCPFGLEEGLELIDIVCQDREIKETPDGSYVAAIRCKKYL